MRRTGLANKLEQAAEMSRKFQESFAASPGIAEASEKARKFQESLLYEDDSEDKTDKQTPAPMKMEPPAIPQPKDRRTGWTDTQVSLAAHIVDLYDQKKIKARSRRQAVLKNAGLWVLVDDQGRRKDVNPVSCWQTYDQQTR